MPRISKAKLDIMQRVDGGTVLGTKNGQPYWVKGEGGPRSADVLALVAAGYLVLLNPKGHAMSTGQRFSVTDKGAALLVPPEPEGDDEDAE